MLIDKHGHIYDDNYFVDKNCDVIFYGASTRNIKAIQTMSVENKVLCYVDGDVSKANKEMDGYKICEKDILFQNKNAIVVTVLVEHVDDVLDELANYDEIACYVYYQYNDDIEKINKHNSKVNLSGRYKYIHFFPDLVFIKHFYNMIEECFDRDEHLFVVNYTNEDDKFGVKEFVARNTGERTNILVCESRLKNSKFLKRALFADDFFESELFLDIVDKAEKIILHSMFFSERCLDFIVKLTDRYASKMVWLAWGADTYYDSNSYVVTDIIKKIAFCYASYARVSYLGANYGINPIASRVQYGYVPEGITCDEKNDDVMHVLLGHSAAEYGNHMEAIQILQPYKDRNIQIICPLSYGSESYKQTVIKEGKRLYGEKFVPLLDFMELEEYYKLLSTIDVAVLPMTRMAAGTTVKYMDTMGIPVFMKEDIKEAFRASRYEVRDICELENMTYEELLETKTHSKSVKDSNSDIVEVWRKIFADKLGDD